MASYVADLQTAGRVVFTRVEAQKALNLKQDAFLKRARRLEKQGLLYSPRRGYYVIVPPQFKSWGAPPPSWFIDDLMQYEECAYYVGLLKAAELHGASHQAVMEFQVVTSMRLPALQAGRSLIKFYYRRDLGPIAGSIQAMKTDTGRMCVSSPELTAFDLVRYPHAGAGLDHILTVLVDLGAKLDATKLAALATAFEQPVQQRLGYLLERAGHTSVTKSLHASLTRGTSLRWSELEPAHATDPDFAPAPLERDSRWHLIVRRMPEADQ
ncbi:MAG: type IV toxin-antitoxin system AbiEi family antitoxin [Cephaloticoccus sp.]|nr:type IV toxin-antitoxin system AbiEi family antitoxin [Cephaloticoccus sp.]MCF7761895.1 type IV toxin-antitoxin system AbiEi family antitoxin [Cephaloticoccus sp.]